MKPRSPALYVVAVGMVVLVAGLIFTVLPGPGLLVAVLGALGMILGLALLMIEHRAEADVAPPSDGRSAADR